MAALTGNTIASTYKDLLQVSNSNSGVDGTLRNVEDGEGTASALQISSSAVNINGGLTASGDVNFDSNTLFVDASANAVGIGEDAPITKLDVRLDSTSTDLTADYAMFINNQTGANSGEHATIGFGTYNNGGLTNVFGAVAEGTGAQSGFAFLTHNGGSLTEKVRIANDGKVGIGESSSLDALLVIKGDSDASTTPSIRLKDGSDTREAWISNTAGDLVLANGGNDNVSHCMIKLFDGNIMQFATAGLERMRIGSDGKIGVNETNPAGLMHIALDDGTMPSVVAAESALVLQNNSAVSDGCTLTIISGNENNSQICFGDAQDYDTGVMLYNNNNDCFTWRTKGTGEDMRLTEDGDLLLGTTSLLGQYGDGRTSLVIKGTGSADYGTLQIGNYGTTGNTQSLGGIYFYDGSNENALIGAYRAASTGDADIKFFTSASGGSISERMKLEYSGNLILQNKTNGLANNIKFAGSATYANSAYTTHSLSGSGALIIITNHSNDSSALFHMDYDHNTVTMIANPGGVDSDGFNNADSGDTIRVFKSSGTFNFTVKNSTGTSKNIGIGQISMHSS